MPYKLEVAPLQAGYSVDFGNDVLQQAVEGGASRFRRDFKRNTHTVNVAWFVQQDDYDYLLAFYNVWQHKNEPYFLADLIIDSAPLQEYQCNFIGGLRLDSTESLTYKLSATFEVKAKKRSLVNDEMIIGIHDIFNPLEKLANEDLPNALKGVKKYE